MGSEYEKKCHAETTGEPQEAIAIMRTVYEMSHVRHAAFVFGKGASGFGTASCGKIWE